MYVTELVAPGTVNTMPESTLHAMADHGRVRPDTGRTGYEQARRLFAGLDALGIAYSDVVNVLEKEGVAKFAASWKEMRDTIKAELDTAGRK
jgi:transaldolase